MTQEAINRACAELCGWKNVRMHYGTMVDARYRDELIGDHEIFGSAWRIPNYTASLDAAQMAFRALHMPRRKAQAIHILSIDILKLCPLAGDYFMAQEVDVCAIMLATPLQWCEAILRAACRWEESK